MTHYRCSQCKTEYSFDDYRALETASRVTDDPDDAYGVETVCECGAGFHSDRWQVVDDFETDGIEFRVSTVALPIPHGPDRRQWYETCVFHDDGSRVTDRYETQTAAERGHEQRVKQLTAGQFAIEPDTMGTRLVLDTDEP